MGDGENQEEMHVPVASVRARNAASGPPSRPGLAFDPYHPNFVQRIPY